MRPLAQAFSVLRDFLSFWTSVCRAELARMSRAERAVLLASLVLTLATAVLFSRMIGGTRLETIVPPDYSPHADRPPQDEAAPRRSAWKRPDLTRPVRPIPSTFRINSTMPAIGEGAASGSIEQFTFVPERDLIRVEDPRVWWESDNDDRTGDTEDDHLMHWALEEPFRRLVELIRQKSTGRLKVQDIYRAEGVHGVRSLHKQGRAIDMTGDGIALSEVAKLAYAAGFDWVYYETRGGAHIHASVNLRGRIRPPAGTHLLASAFP